MPMTLSTRFATARASGTRCTPSLTVCPSPELLRRSLDPDSLMTDEERERIAAHVDACRQGCRQTIAVFLETNVLSPGQCKSPPVDPCATLAPRPAEEPVPARIGRYDVLARLGAGGMGVVFRGRDPQLGRDVAIKIPVFRGSDAARNAARQRFLREAHSAAAVQHAHICPIYDIGEHEGRPFVVLALVEGESLADRLQREGRFEDPRAAVELLLKVAEALVSVHAARIVHRDLKPGNILLDRAGQPFLTDFGLARAAEGDHLTSAGEVVGTPAYMAPEQAVPELGTIGPRSDQFSLGAVLYRMLTGRFAFEGSVAAVIFQIGSKPVPAPSIHRPDLDPVLEQILLKSMSRRPQDRYASIVEFAEALRGWQQSRPEIADQQSSTERRRALLRESLPAPEPSKTIVPAAEDPGLAPRERTASRVVPDVDAHAQQRCESAPQGVLPPRVLWTRRSVLGALVAATAGGLAWWRSRPDLTLARERFDRDLAVFRTAKPALLRNHSPTAQSVPSLSYPDYSSFAFLCDERIWDLRGFRQRSADDPPMTSAAHLVRYVRATKIAEAREIRFEGRTGGTEIFLRCPSHPDRSQEFLADAKGLVGDEPLKARQIAIDVGDVPVGDTLNLQVNQTMWDSLQTPAACWLGMVDTGSPSLRMTILFPDSRPIATHALEVTPLRSRDLPVPFHGESIFLIDSSRTAIRWEIPKPVANQIYRFSWRW